VDLLKRLWNDGYAKARSDPEQRGGYGGRLLTDFGAEARPMTARDKFIMEARPD
jgi:hypothetical protein